MSEYSPEYLLQAAVDYLHASETLTAESAYYFDAAAYLGHVSLELMLKSYLLYSRQSFSPGHNLIGLYEEINDGAPRIIFEEHELALLKCLSKLHEIKYPSKDQPIEIGEDDLGSIKVLANKIYSFLPDRLIEAYQNIPPGKKGHRVLMEKKTP